MYAGARSGLLSSLQTYTPNASVGLDKDIKKIFILQ